MTGAMTEGVQVLNALQVLERMGYQPGDRVLVENFLRILGERGMFVIQNPLTPDGAQAVRVGEHNGGDYDMTHRTHGVSASDGQTKQRDALRVEIEAGRIWIKRGGQSFMLAYDAESDDEQQWYARMLRRVLGLP
jgi:hypothetical protein